MMLRGPFVSGAWEQSAGLLTWYFLDGTSLLTRSDLRAYSVQPTSLLQFCFAPAIGTSHSRREEGLPPTGPPEASEPVSCKTRFSFTPSGGLSGVILAPGSLTSPAVFVCSAGGEEEHPNQLLVQANI